MKAKTIISQPKPKVSIPEEDAFLKLYCACLTGVASQLETTFTLDEGLPPRDVYGEDQEAREQDAVKRAYRMAALAMEELQINHAFSK